MQASRPREESKMTQQQMMQKKFEFENEVIEEELFQFSEQENDRILAAEPWLKE